MSASSKKKFRREQASAQMTERQIQEQKEAKNLKIMTIVFVAVVVLALVVAVSVSASKLITRSGVFDRNTVALNIGDKEISSAELSYYYVDAINSFYQDFYNNYGSNAAAYAKLFYGLDFTSPLGDQVHNSETGETWADYFIDQAIATAVSTYTMCEEADKAGFTLSEDAQKSVDSTISYMALYASLYGYSDTDSYLKAMYGYGSSEESYTEYCTMSTLAYTYQTETYNNLEYTNEDLREKDKEDPKPFNSYSYAVYSLNASDFYEGGTIAEGSTTPTYSEEEKAAGLEKCEGIANGLAKATSLEELNKLIKALEINAKKDSAAATEYTDTAYSSVLSTYKDWVTADEREAGDITVIAKTSTSTGEDGKETTTTTGYYVIMFQGMKDNTFTLPSVRHLLVAFEGGTTDSSGNTTYTDAEKAAAKKEAEELLAQWKEGDATEESFAALATEKTDDTSSKENGGLYEDIYPGQMVTNFNDWTYDEARKVGDTGIVESPYGYHVMYYVSDGDTTYRDYMIENTLRNADFEEWYNALVEAAKYTKGNTSRLNRDLTISK